MRVERVTVAEDAVEAVVRFEPGEPLRTSQVPGLPGRALATLPRLARHRCDNDAGSPFAEELRDTELAHLLEHVACELMAMAGSRQSLKGETAWDFARDGRGAFRVRLEYDDDLVALGAVKGAAAILGALLGGGEPPDPHLIAEDLRRLRGVPPEAV